MTGIGVHGKCVFVANDATVKGGSYYPMTVKKHIGAQEIAEENNLPASTSSTRRRSCPCRTRSSPTSSTSAGYSGTRRYSGGHPQVAAVLGPAAGGAYIPAMSDESIIVKGNGTIFLAGPPLVKAATGEEVSAQDLAAGGPHVESGVADHYAEDEEDALRIVRNIVENLNVQPKHRLDTAAPEPPAYDVDDLLGIAPEDNGTPYDVRDVISRIVDDSRFHEFKRRCGGTLVCGFARVHGYPVGIVANNGILFSESSQKGAHFVGCAGSGASRSCSCKTSRASWSGGTPSQEGWQDGAKLVTAVSCVPSRSPP